MKSNTRFNKNHKGKECLNCKLPVKRYDNFCAYCGQVNDTKPLSIKQYITELLGGFFAFDTRTLNTLKPLLLSPGSVTENYVKGERMKYVNPFQLYLHTSIMFFLVTSIFMSIDAYESMLNKTKTNYTKTSINQFQKDTINTSILQHISKESKTIINKRTFIKTINDTVISKKQKDKIINNLVLKKLDNLYDKIEDNALFENDSLYVYEKFKKVFISTLEKEMSLNDIKYTINLPKESNDITTETPWLKKYVHFYNSKTKNVVQALDSLGYEKTNKNIFLFTKFQEFKKVTKGGDSGRTFLNNMISKSSLVMFFMLPLFTLFIRLLYIRRKFNYTEHLIFVFNIQTVFFILFLIGVIFDRIFETNLGIIIVLLVFLFYLYKAMRKFYKQGWLKTIIKFLMLNFIYFILSIFGLLMVAFLAFII